MPEEFNNSTVDSNESSPKKGSGKRVVILIIVIIGVLAVLSAIALLLPACLG